MGNKGMASKHALPHGSFAWGARLHPNVRRVFAELYEMGEEEKKPETERPKMGAVFEGAQR